MTTAAPLVWVSWCCSCGAAVVADVDREVVERSVCSRCPAGGEGDVRVERYALAPVDDSRDVDPQTALSATERLSERVCEVCTKSLVGRRKDARVCSDACRAKAHRKGKAA